MKTALILGAGGFIGSHMVKRLKAEGYWVRGVDLKDPEFSKTEADSFVIGDLREAQFVSTVLMAPEQHSVNSSEAGFDEVYQFAADMGGAGYIFTGDHDADVMHNSALINIHVAKYAVKFGVKKLFYSSSACMYPQELQISSNTDKYKYEGVEVSGHTNALAESMAYPANPDSEYGWEKLFSERLYLAYARNHGLDVRIARFHNIYGPEGTYKGGKEKAPAAMCRKVVEAFHDGVIEIWGDGEQMRSFLYIDDCIDAVRLLMKSDHKRPINIGSEEAVTINQLADYAIGFAGANGIGIVKKYIDGPIGVRGRNSDNAVIRTILGWEPAWTLKRGLFETYWWIREQYMDPPNPEDVNKIGYKFL